MEIEAIGTVAVEKFTALQNEFKAGSDALQASAELSPEGKSRKATELETKFHSAAAAIQKEALEEISYKTDILQRDAVNERAAQAKDMRAELGDVVYADFLKADVKALETPEAIQALFDNSSEGFEKRVVGLAALQHLREFANNSNAVACSRIIQTALYGEKRVQREKSLNQLGYEREHIVRHVNPNRAAEIRARFKIG